MKESEAVRAEYERKLSDPAFLTQRLAEVTGLDVIVGHVNEILGSIDPAPEPAPDLPPITAADVPVEVETPPKQRRKRAAQDEG